MKLTQEVYDILTHCAKISNHLVVEKGQVISSINPDRNRLMVAEVDTELEPFALHDLKNFLRQLSLFDDPILTFNETNIIIEDKEARSTYRQSNKEDLCYLDRKLGELDIKHKFDLPSNSFDKIIRASAANKTEDILLCSENNNIYIKALNKDKPTRVFSVNLHQKSDQDFEIYIKHSIKNKLNLILTDYTVNISTSGVVVFKSKEPKITFYIASER